MVDQEKDDPEWIRKLAAEEVEHLKQVRFWAIEQHALSFRWLMASLLAINSAALLAVWNSEKFGSLAQLQASCLFVGGILFALLIAAMGLRSTKHVLEPVGELIGYWHTVVDDAERDESIENALMGKLQKARRWDNVSDYVAAVSGVLFLGGCIVAGADWHSSLRLGEASSEIAP